MFVSIRTGDRLKVQILGSDDVQRQVGYLADGSIVLVDGCSQKVGQEIEVIVYFINHGSNCREILARYAEIP